MKCIVCKHGETTPGFVTVTVDRGPTIAVVRNVPALVCSNCGEEYLEGESIARVEILVTNAENAGMNVAVQQYQAA
jgi:YgiT-type zinc finger domain-containing protein